MIRDKVRQLVARLQSWSLPNIEFLRLECSLHRENENIDINWADPCWDNYEGDGNAQECARVLRTWLGRLRHVKEVAIEGLGTEHAEILQKKLETARNQEDNDSPSRPLSLTDMYEQLEECVGDMGFCEEDLRRALSAVEEDDEEAFQACKDDIFNSLHERWDIIKSHDSLWELSRERRGTMN